MSSSERSFSAWAPFREGAFALLWTATLISNVGPALAGFLITAVGLAAPFALSHVIIIGALLAWKPPPPPSRRLPPEPLVAAMLTALRHVTFNGPLKATMLRAAGFFIFASAHWPAPIVADGIEPADERGPVMITIEYRIDVANEDEFLAAMRALSGERYRDGARQWGICEDAEAPGTGLEWFQLSSWTEHLRQHERTTRHDQGLHARARSFHGGDEPPRVRHWLSPGKRD